MALLLFVVVIAIFLIVIAIVVVFGLLVVLSEIGVHFVDRIIRQMHEHVV